jgi:hypothetical protein
MLSNSKNIVMEWMSPPHTLAQLLLTTLYIYFVENRGTLKVNNYFQNPIVIYDSKLFEEN